MTNTVYDGLLGGADPVRRFAVIPGQGGAKNRHYSYQDVFDVSARFANTLVSRGVRPGDRVAAQVPKSIEALMLYLGVVRAGAVFLPLNTAYTEAEVAYFIEDAEPRLFLCDPKDVGSYGAMAGHLGVHLDGFGIWRGPDASVGSFFDAAEGAGTEFETVPRGPDDLAGILYTSGTTGRSKGAMLTHRNLLSNAEALAECWRFTAEDVLLHALPVFHTHGLFVATNIMLRAGGSMIVLPRFDAEAVLRHLPEATAMMGVPTFYTRLLASDGLTREAVGHMRLFVSGSAPLLAETHRQFEARTGHAILERYGLTETGMNTTNPYDGPPQVGDGGDAPARRGAAHPRPGDRRGYAERRDRRDRSASGENVCKGYWRMPEKTKEDWREDGFFVTGDLGRIDDDGYVVIVGRGKDLIISGGFNVYPKEIEDAIDALEGVVESAVIGAPHPDFGEGVIAVVVPKPDALLDEAGVQAALGDRLAKFKRPKRVVFADALPRNTMGKVQKNLLRDAHKDIFA